MMSNYKEFRNIESRIKSLSKRFEVIGCVNTYNIYHVSCGNGDKNVFLSGTVHGDEIAGVYTILEFLEKHSETYFNSHNFNIIPLVNPTGFINGRVDNYAKFNLNREFGKNSDVVEINCIESLLKKLNKRFTFTMDFHETDPFYKDYPEWKGDIFPTESWIYETEKDLSKRIGRKMIEELPMGTEVCNWDKINQDTNCNGVISYPEDCCNPIYQAPTNLDSYINKYYSDHSFTTETPKGWSIEKRVAIHLSYLKSALKYL